MRILIAEDEEVSRLKLEGLLAKWGYEVVAASDGKEAWQALQVEQPPKLAVFDWMMPEIDGLALCRQVRQTPRLRGLYILLVTARGSKEHVLEGLQAGANDYVAKPFDPDELHARIRVAAQMVQMQSELAARVKDLEEALAEVRSLQEMLPICCYCKKIRDDQKYWHQVEQYITVRFAAEVTSGICPECWEKEVKPQIQEAGLEELDYPSR